MTSRMFKLGSGIKFRGSVGTGGNLVLEVRRPDAWYPVTAPDLQASALQALALAAIGALPSGFAFTLDDRFIEGVPNASDPNYAQYNPFVVRDAQRFGC